MGHDKRLAALKDIATNKAFSIIDTPRPEDVVDLYIVMKQGGVLYTHILHGLKKKMGCFIDPTTFFAQVLASCRKMQHVPYLLYMNNESKQKEYVRKIEAYFGKLSADFLHKRLLEMDQ